MFGILKKEKQKTRLVTTKTYVIEPFVDHGKKFYKVYTVINSLTCGPIHSRILEIFEKREDAEIYVENITKDNKTQA